MDLGSRIFNLLKSISTDQIDQFDTMLRESKQHIYEELEKWEKKHGIKAGEPWEQKQSANKQSSSQRTSHQKNSYQQQSRSQNQSQNSAYPEDFLQDLATFNLKPPVSLEGVKKARNREIKKYHPDKFANDPVKQETAKEILQLINGAFDRLQKHRLMKK